MQRTLLALAAGLTFIGASTSSTFSQSSSQGGGGSTQYGQQHEQAPPSGRGDWPEGRSRHERRGGYAQNEPDEDGPPGPGFGGPPSPAHRKPPPSPGAARFVFQRGAARIAITCPQVFALQDCVQAAGELLDKIHSLHSGEAHSGAGRTGGAGESGGNANPPSPSEDGHHPMPNVTPQLLVPNPHGEGQM